MEDFHTLAREATLILPLDQLGCLRHRRKSGAGRRISGFPTSFIQPTYLNDSPSGGVL